MKKVTINGQAAHTAARTVRELVVELGHADHPVAVEVNQQLVPRKAHEQTPLRDGDVIEIVTLVGGG